MRGLVSSERLRGVVVSAETVSGSEFLTRRMPSVRDSLQLTPGEGWSKLMEDLTDLRKVLPEASGTAGFFWNSLSFDCFPIVCSQTGRLKKAAETGRPQINIYLPNVRGEEHMYITPSDRRRRQPNAVP